MAEVDSSRGSLRLDVGGPRFSMDVKTGADPLPRSDSSVGPDTPPACPTWPRMFHAAAALPARARWHAPCSAASAGESHAYGLAVVGSGGSRRRGGGGGGGGGRRGGRGPGGGGGAHHDP